MKVCFAVLASSVLFAIGTSSGISQDYPNKPLRIVVAFTQGGANDVLARLVGKELAERWRQPVVVDNRPGGGGNIGTALVAKAPADGYTLLFVPSSFGSNQSLYRTLPYDTLKDFAGVSWVAKGEAVLAVHPSLGVESLRDLVGLAKSKPGQLNYASSGIGTSPHLRGELLKSATGIDIMHVTYKGNTPALMDLLAGRVSIAFTDLFLVIPHAKAGKLKLLGVIGDRRSQHFPDVPTLTEAGVPGFETGMWLGIVVPAATPREIIRKLNEEIVKIVHLPEVKERMNKLGFEPVGSTAEQFDGHIRAEVAKWAKVVKDAGIVLGD
jgi:tripartite-type tricarboxylate transporter receptor subunit TctC